MDAGRTLIVTNDFPPRTGGIESFVLAMAQRMPADRVVVHTARQPGDRTHDAALSFPVVRDPSPLMVPTRPDELFFVGTGATDFECGTCGALLARDMEPDGLDGTAVRCPSCRRWNRV